VQLLKDKIMKLHDVKSALKGLTQIGFQLPDGTLVPGHFHVTEVGEISKHFIDCGGIERHEKVVNFQLWNANDYDHRLHPERLANIISLSEEKLGLGNLEVEVEYQAGTIGKFGLEFDGINFVLTNKQTDCLAMENCGLPTPKTKLQLIDIPATADACLPGSGCC
jgi:hypothetical protein